MGWLLAAAVLTLLGIMPVGIYAAFDSSGAYAKLVIGPFRYSLYPRRKKIKESKKGSSGDSFESYQKSSNSGGSFSNFIPIAKLVLKFLSDFKRRLTIRFLRMKLILAGDDPCNVAINYGCAWAALGNLQPLLERCFVIKKRDLAVECDFTADQTRINIQIDLVIPLARLLAIAVRHGIPILREYSHILNKTKGGATS